MDKAKQIYKKYTGTVTTIRLAAFLLYFVLSAILSIIGLFPLVFPLVVVLCVIVRKLTFFKFRQHITGIIIDDLDASLYREVIISSGLGTKNILFAVESEFFAGNISGAIALAEAAYGNVAVSKKTKIYSLAFLAQYYYVLDDDERLAYTCRRFRDSDLLRRGVIFKTTEKVIRKYEYYLAGDYESFIKPITAKQKGTLYPLVTSFNEARVALKKGDAQTARTVFSALSAAAENTVFGMISRRAVEAIDGGKEYREAVAQNECEDVDAEAAVAKYVAESRKSNKVRRILYIVIAVLLVIYLPQSNRSYRNGVDEIVTQAVFERVYGEAEILDIVSFKLKGEKTEKIVLADVGGELVVGGKYWSDEGEMILVSYVRIPYSELAEKGSLIYSFNPRGTSEFLYIKIYDYFEVFVDNDYLLCQTYYVNDNLITVIIDEGMIE